MVVEPKSNGSVRICVNLKEKALNQSVRVEGNPSKTKIEEIMANKLFHYKLVAKSGFSINHSRMLVVMVIDLVIVIVCMIIRAID